MTITYPLDFLPSGGGSLLSLLGLPGRADGGPGGRVSSTHKPEAFL